MARDYDKSDGAARWPGNPDFIIKCDQVTAAVSQSLDAEALISDLPIDARHWFKPMQDRCAQRRLARRRDAVTGPPLWSGRGRR